VNPQGSIPTTLRRQNIMFHAGKHPSTIFSMPMVTKKSTILLGTSGNYGNFRLIDAQK
jgi:hypothetical protein